VKAHHVEGKRSYTVNSTNSITSDHRTEKARHPVRSALFKLSIGCVVVGWVTTSEFQLLLVIFILLFCPIRAMFGVRVLCCF
jgi:hypothetical protein